MFGHRNKMLEIATMSNDLLVSVGYDRRPIVWDMLKSS